MKRKVYLTFPQNLIRHPLIYEVGRKFKVVTNVRCASITDEVGLVGLEFDGEASEIGHAIDYLKSKGVAVERVEMNVVE
jgi:ABC-type methionine transport system ATPase subunit